MYAVAVCCLAGVGERQILVYQLGGSVTSHVNILRFHEACQGFLVSVPVKGTFSLQVPFKWSLRLARRNWRGEIGGTLVFALITGSLRTNNLETRI